MNFYIVPVQVFTGFPLTLIILHMKPTELFLIDKLDSPLFFCGPVLRTNIIL